MVGVGGGRGPLPAVAVRGVLLKKDTLPQFGVLWKVNVFILTHVYRLLEFNFEHHYLQRQS